MILKPKYNDEVIELNLEDPEVAERVTNLIQKGMYFDKKGKAELDDLKAKTEDLGKYNGDSNSQYKPKHGNTQ